MDAKQKNQVIIIGGGNVFENKEEYYEYLKSREYNPFEKSRKWRNWLEWSLSEDYETMIPTMPNLRFADYRSWSIWLEKLFPYLNRNKLILIGHSLGGIFLAKYLSENNFPKKIDQLHLVAPVFDNSGLQDETVGDFAFDPKNLPIIESKVRRIHIYQSKDDKSVPVAHAQKYLDALPGAELHLFEDRGHFRQPAFPELLQIILNDSANNEK